MFRAHAHATTRPLARLARGSRGRHLTRLHVTLYRRSGGRIGRRLRGAPVLLLEHVGRRRGARRITPLLYLDDGDDLVIVASRGGSDAPPAWWINLEARSRTTVQVGRERRGVVARTATAEEKDRLWPRLVDLYPDYEAYRQRTEREIPVIVLEPADDGGAPEVARQGALGTAGRCGRRLVPHRATSSRTEFRARATVQVGVSRRLEKVGVSRRLAGQSRAAYGP